MNNSKIVVSFAAEPLYIREGIFKKEIDECADLKSGCNIFVNCKIKYRQTFGYFCSALRKRIMLSVLVVSESSKKCFSKVLMLSMGGATNFPRVHLLHRRENEINETSLVP